MNPFSAAEGFDSYAICVGILVLKMIGSAIYTATRRSAVKAGLPFPSAGANVAAGHHFRAIADPSPPPGRRRSNRAQNDRSARGADK